jgi:hypothetical protein
MGGGGGRDGERVAGVVGEVFEYDGREEKEGRKEGRRGGWRVTKRKKKIRELNRRHQLFQIDRKLFSCSRLRGWHTLH